jgi:hypothetical protein
MGELVELGALFGEKRDDFLVGVPDDAAQPPHR